VSEANERRRSIGSHQRVLKSPNRWGGEVNKKNATSARENLNHQGEERELQETLKAAGEKFATSWRLDPRGMGDENVISQYAGRGGRRHQKEK